MQLAFAHSTQTVFYIMTGVFVVTFLLVVRGIPRGHLTPATGEEPAPAPTAREAAR